MSDPSLLAQLRQLPSPWHSEMITGDASTDKAEWGCWCEWCKVDIKASSTFFNEQLPAHPANGCLWYIAHAAILEAQPPETAPTPLARLHEIDAELSESHIGIGIALVRQLISDMAAPTPDPPAETPTPMTLKRYRPGAYGAMVEDEDGTFVDVRDLAPIASGTNHVSIAVTREQIAAMAEAERQAGDPDITVGAVDTVPLAPLITLTEQQLEDGAFYVRDLKDEIDAQRQASASVRREAIDEAIIAVRGWSNFDGWASVEHVVDSLKALREPRVSPRPTSGGGQ